MQYDSRASAAGVSTTRHPQAAGLAGGDYTVARKPFGSLEDLRRTAAFVQGTGMSFGVIDKKKISFHSDSYFIVCFWPCCVYMILWANAQTGLLSLWTCTDVRTTHSFIFGYVWSCPICNDSNINIGYKIRLSCQSLRALVKHEPSQQIYR